MTQEKNLTDMTEQEVEGLSDSEFIRLTREHLGTKARPTKKQRKAAQSTFVDLTGKDSLAGYDDDSLVRFLRTGEPPAGISATGTVEGAELSASGEPGDELTDDQFLWGYRTELDGTAATERTARRLNAAFEAELADAKAAHERGEVIDRWHEECLRDMGEIS